MLQASSGKGNQGPPVSVERKSLTKVQHPGEISEWIPARRKWSWDRLRYRGRIPFTVGIKTTKYVRAEKGVSHVERECSFCVEGRAKAMIQKAAKPLTASDGGQFSPSSSLYSTVLLSLVL